MRIVAEIGQAQGFLQQAAIGVRIGAHAPCARGRKRLEFGNQPPAFVEQLFGLLAAHPVFELLQVGRVFLTSASGTWWARQHPSTLWPSTSFGPVQPLGLRSTIIGHRGRVALPLERLRF